MDALGIAVLLFNLCTVLVINLHWEFHGSLKSDESQSCYFCFMGMGKDMGMSWLKCDGKKLYFPLTHFFYFPVVNKQIYRLLLQERLA